MSQPAPQLEIILCQTEDGQTRIAGGRKASRNRKLVTNCYQLKIVLSQLVSICYRLRASGSEVVTKCDHLKTRCTRACQSVTRCHRLKASQPVTNCNRLKILLKPATQW